MAETIGGARSVSRGALFKRYVALPQDHGAWVFLLSPLLIGIFAGGSLRLPSLALVVLLLAAFLLRQPATILVKIKSGRRSKSDQSSAFFWLGIYVFIALFAIIFLIFTGFSWVLLLGIPAAPIFAWHLFLVSKREERHQAGVEILGAGVLALAAPAAYWVGTGAYQSLGWALWALTWLQSAASIVYAYLRLAQRELSEVPDRTTEFTMGFRSALYVSFNLVISIAAAATGRLPELIWSPYLVQWGETMWGIFHPAIGVKPTKIGIRQLIVSSIFTLLFILAWRI